MDRKEYWNKNYVNYWKEKVKVANDQNSNDITIGDSKSISDNEAYSFLDKIPPVFNGNILDFGCGFGRLYNFLVQKGYMYYGVDIPRQ